MDCDPANALGDCHAPNMTMPRPDLAQREALPAEVVQFQPAGRSCTVISFVNQTWYYWDFFYQNYWDDGVPNSTLRWSTFSQISYERDGGEYPFDGYLALRAAENFGYGKINASEWQVLDTEGYGAGGDVWFRFDLDTGKLEVNETWSCDDMDKNHP